jgi:Arc/MetJ-type ribon-helix-helix transcriptional regulator
MILSEDFLAQNFRAADSDPNSFSAMQRGIRTMPDQAAAITVSPELEAVARDRAVATDILRNPDLPPVIADAVRALVGACLTETERRVAEKVVELERAVLQRDTLEREVATLRDRVDEQKRELERLGAQLAEEQAERQALEDAATDFVGALEAIQAKRLAEPGAVAKCRAPTTRKARKKKSGEAGIQPAQPADADCGGASSGIATEDMIAEAAAEETDGSVEITLRLPRPLVAEVDRQVDLGRYASRADGLRALILAGWQRGEAAPECDRASSPVFASTNATTDAASNGATALGLPGSIARASDSIAPMSQSQPQAADLAEGTRWHVELDPGDRAPDRSAAQPTRKSDRNP